MDITLVIQGRLTQETYDFYSNNYPDKKKIFSTWSNNNVEFEQKENQTVLKSEDPRSGWTRQNLNLQVFSTMVGLKEVQTNFAIKLRGDEKYSNLTGLLDVLEAHENKMCTIPVFFRRWNHYPFHISDHLIAGSTKNLRLMFEESWKTVNSAELLARHTGFRNSAETIITKSYLDAKTGRDLRPDAESKQIFKKNFVIVSLNFLSPYEISFFNKRTNDFNPYNFGSISNINEI